MPGWIFYIVLNMSIVSCVVIAVLFLLRLIKPIPRRYIYPLWALAFFRLVMPFTLTSGLSLFNFTGGLVKRLVDVETITRGAVSAPASVDLMMMNMIGAVNRYDPIAYKTGSLRQIFTVSSAVWAVVAAGALIAVCLMYSFTYKELKRRFMSKEIFIVRAIFYLLSLRACSAQILPPGSIRNISGRMIPSMRMSIGSGWITRGGRWLSGSLRTPVQSSCG